MDTTLSDVEIAVHESMKKFFERESPSTRVRAAEPLGYDSKLWSDVLKVGLLRMSAPSAAGGDEASFVCLLLAAEQAGASLAPVPLIESTVALRVLAEVGSVQADEMVRSMLAGESITVFSPRPLEMGSARLVAGGAVADQIVCLDGDDLVLAELPAAEERESPRNLGSMPLVNSAIVKRVRLASGQAAREIVETALAEWKALTAGALVGLAARAFDMGLAYAKERRAFGTLIGAFQTVSHRLADNIVDLDGARLLSYEAAWALDENPSDAPHLASMAFIFSTEVARRCAGVSLHIHGGTGFTMEHDSQLYYRRAHAWPLAYRGLDREYQHLADLLYGKSGAAK